MQIWTRLNGLLTGTARVTVATQKFGLVQSSQCNCSPAEQMVNYVLEKYTIRRLEGGLPHPAMLDDGAVRWLNSLDIDL